MAPTGNGNREPHFLTPKEAAAYLGVVVRTIYRWSRKPTAKGGLPLRNFGSKKHPCYRIPKDKFIEWANGNAEK